MAKAPAQKLPRSASALTARSKAVQAVLDHVASEIDVVPARALAPMGSVLRAARAEVERDLRRYLSSVDEASPFTRAQYHNALVQLRGALERIAELEPGLAHALAQGTDVAGNLAVKHVQYELRQFANIFGHEIRALPILPAAQLIIDRGERSRMRRVKSSALRYAGRVGQDLRQQLAIGMLRGESMRDMVRRLVGPGARVKLGRIDTLPQASGLISERLFRKYGSWATTIVRTEVLNAYNVVANDTIEEAHAEDPRIMRRWDAALDARMCPACGRLDHVVVRIGVAFPYGGGDGPPLHPCCRCAVVAWRSDWEEAGRVRVHEPRPAPPIAPNDLSDPIFRPLRDNLSD